MPGNGRATVATFDDGGPAVGGALARTASSAGRSAVFAMALVPFFFAFVYAPDPLALPVPAAALVVACLLLVVPFTRGSRVLLSPGWLASIGLPLAFGAWSSTVAIGFATWDFTFASICIKYMLAIAGATALWLIWSGLHASWRESYRTWLWMLVLVGTLQSVAVLAEVLVPGVKDLLNATLAYSGNIDYTEGFNVRGLGRAGGAGGSLVQALVVLVCLAIYAMSGRAIALIAACVGAAACMFLGRTGFIFAAGSFLLLLIWRPRRGAGAVLILVAFFALVAAIFNAAAGEKFQELWRWIVFFSLEPFENLLAGEGFRAASTEELSGMYHLPYRPHHLLLGSGFFETAHWGYGLSDVGYLKTVYAVGLPLAVLVYLAFLLAAINAFVRARDRYASILPCLVVAAGMFVVAELKEPFLYQNAAARLLLLLFVPLLIPTPRGLLWQSQPAPAPEARPGCKSAIEPESLA